MIGLLTDEKGVALQFLIWGYALTGNVCEKSAALAEAKSHHSGYPMWDRTAADIANSLIGYGDEPYRRVKDRAALPWVTEHLIRGHEPYSPL